MLPELPAEVWQHIASYFRLAHHIGRVAPTCKVVSVAVRNAIKVRQFSGEVVTLAGHTDWVQSVAARPDGRIITASIDRLRFVSGSYDKTARIAHHGLAA